MKLLYIICIIAGFAIGMNTAYVLIGNQLKDNNEQILEQKHINNCNFNIPDYIDIRIITLSKGNETHDYVIANNKNDSIGPIAIEHWAGCKCRYPH